MVTPTGFLDHPAPNFKTHFTETNFKRRREMIIQGIAFGVICTMCSVPAGHVKSHANGNTQRHDVKYQKSSSDKTQSPKWRIKSNYFSLRHSLNWWILWIQDAGWSRQVFYTLYHALCFVLFITCGSMCFTRLLVPTFDILSLCCLCWWWKDRNMF